MRVRIDKSWSGNLPFQIDFLFTCAARKITNFDDAVTIDADITFKAVSTGTVDHYGIFNQQIKLYAHLFQLQINENLRCDLGALVA
jgi:hypothetical protein